MTSLDLLLHQLSDQFFEIALGIKCDAPEYVSVIAFVEKSAFSSQVDRGATYLQYVSDVGAENDVMCSVGLSPLAVSSPDEFCRLTDSLEAHILEKTGFSQRQARTAFRSVRRRQPNSRLPDNLVGHPSARPSLMDIFLKSLAQSRGIENG